MGWRKVAEEFSKTDGRNQGSLDCLFCIEVDFMGSRRCPSKCPLICINDTGRTGRCYYVFGYPNNKMTNERRLKICNHVIATVKRYTLKNIRAAISSQLTKAERKLYEGE